MQEAEHEKMVEAVMLSLPVPANMDDGRAFVTALRERGYTIGKAPVVMKVVFEEHFPFKTISEANKRDVHWAPKHKRASGMRGPLNIAMRSLARNHPFVRDKWPVYVELTRHTAGKLDGHDNLMSALKHASDGVADFLGLRDDDIRIVWLPPQQERCARGKFGLTVRLLQEE